MMTEDEVNNLELGDVVYRKRRRVTGTTWDKLEVRFVTDGGYLICRRVGLTKSNRKFPTTRIRPRDFPSLSPPIPGDQYKANVYADWLEERGEVRAAAMLRGQFPHDVGGKLQ